MVVAFLDCGREGAGGVGRRVVDGWRCGLFVSFEGEGEGGCRGLIRGRDGGTFAGGRLKSIF